MSMYANAKLHSSSIIVALINQHKLRVSIGNFLMIQIKKINICQSILFRYREAQGASHHDACLNECDYYFT